MVDRAEHSKTRSRMGVSAMNQHGAGSAAVPMPPRALFADIAVGLRVGNKASVPWAIAHEQVDIVVLDASSMPTTVPASWRPRNGKLLIDPNTDLFVAGQAGTLFPDRAANRWHWLPDPMGPALLQGGRDNDLVKSVLDWQAQQGVDALITPYLRILDWPTATRPNSVHLDRTVDVITAAAAHCAGGRLPLFGAVALPRDCVLDLAVQTNILNRLNQIAGIDGVYLVAQAPTTAPQWHRANWLKRLKEFGETVHRAGKQAILGQAGSELLPLLATGAWDAIVTSNARVDRYPTFKNQNGQWTPTATIDRFFAAAVLDDVPVPTLSYVAPRDRGLIVCGCAACAAVVNARGVISFDGRRAREHYLASMTRAVAALRAAPRATRFATLNTQFGATIVKAEAAETGITTGSMQTRSRLEFWMSTLT
jgi:hypothetical protein